MRYYGIEFYSLWTLGRVISTRVLKSMSDCGFSKTLCHFVSELNAVWTDHIPGAWLEVTGIRLEM